MPNFVGQPYRTEFLKLATESVATASHAIATVTITDPGSGKADVYVPQILVLYAGGSNPTGNVVIQQGTGFKYTQQIGGSNSSIFQVPVRFSYFPAGKGNIVYTLDDGGVGVTGILIVYYLIHGSSGVR